MSRIKKFRRMLRDQLPLESIPLETLRPRQVRKLTAEAMRIEARRLALLRCGEKGKRPRNGENDTGKKVVFGGKHRKARLVQGLPRRNIQRYGLLKRMSGAG